MTDRELVDAFEACTLPVDAFPHAAHVRVAWWYLSHLPFPEALSRFVESLKRFAAAHGVPNLYHDTITLAYLLAIRERLDGCEGLSWAEFSTRHPELLAKNPPLLARYYTDALLRSDRARRVFVMPDRFVP